MTIKIWEETLKNLRLLHAETGEAMVVILDRLVQDDLLKKQNRINSMRYMCNSCEMVYDSREDAAMCHPDIVVLPEEGFDNPELPRRKLNSAQLENFVEHVRKNLR